MTAKFKGNTLGRVTKSNFDCHCATCHLRIRKGKPHFRLFHGKYSFKLCGTCLHSFSTILDRNIRKFHRDSAKLLTQFDMEAPR